MMRIYIWSNVSGTAKAVLSQSFKSHCSDLVVRNSFSSFGLSAFFCYELVYCREEHRACHDCASANHISLHIPLSTHLPVSRAAIRQRWEWTNHSQWLGPTHQMNASLSNSGSGNCKCANSEGPTLTKWAQRKKKNWITEDSSRTLIHLTHSNNSLHHFIKLFHFISFFHYFFFYIAIVDMYM